MSYNLRIDENFLRGDHVDGEVLQHTDLNELENVAKTAINANYEDIQKLQDGTTLIGNSEKLDGATLSKFATETLQNSDTKVPTSSQVKQYVDGAISNIDLSGYYTKRETDDLLEENYYSKDETIPCFVGTEENPIEITEAFNSLSSWDDNLIFVKGVKTLCEDYVPDGELFYRMPGFHGEYTIYDLTDGVMYGIRGGLNPSVISRDDTRLSIVGGDYYNPVNLDTIGYGTYILARQASYILGDVTYHTYNDSYSIVNIKSMDMQGDKRRYVWSDGTVQEVERVEDGGTYSYNLIEVTHFVDDVELSSTLTQDFENFAEYVDETYAKPTDIPDLTDYVKNTDYASSSNTGVVRMNNEFNVSSSNGGVYCTDLTYETYSARGRNIFISKGTLENVLTARIGDIQTLLDNLDTGSGV